jgi:hypothetical protein
MTPRPNSNSYTKFIISAGAFLVVAAFVLPGFILRDTGALTISRSDLEGFTPTARHELERRQAWAHDASNVAPFLGIVLFAGGALLIALGVPRLKRQEQTADEHAKAELDKIHRELRPQTPREEQERAEAELVDRQPKPAAVARPQEPPASRATSRSKQLQMLAQAEEKVLTRLAKIAPPTYELQSRITLDSAASGRLLLDALLISQIDQIPDIVVEIKLAGAHINRHISDRMAQAESQLLRYLAQYRRDSIGWLILYATEELTAKGREQIARRTASINDLLKVSVITPETLESLTLPVDY